MISSTRQGKTSDQSVDNITHEHRPHSRHPHFSVEVGQERETVQDIGGPDYRPRERSLLCSLSSAQARDVRPFSMPAACRMGVAIAGTSAKTPS
jgi:hypothetical protein